MMRSVSIVARAGRTGVMHPGVIHNMNQLEADMMVNFILYTPFLERLQILACDHEWLASPQRQNWRTLGDIGLMQLVTV